MLARSALMLENEKKNEDVCDESKRRKKEKIGLLSLEMHREKA